MKNKTDYNIHALHQKRWSPYSFDPNKDVSNEDLCALFEAVRWTMSSYGAQPWRYIVGVKSRNPEHWQNIYDILLDGNKPWAQYAPVLVLGIAETVFEYNGKPNKAAYHDLGAASASLSLEATARDLSVHQMIGIDPEKAHSVFALSETSEAFTALAIGYAGENAALDDEFRIREQRPRERKAFSEIILKGLESIK